MKSSRDLHAESINAREKEQDFLKALKLLDEALILAGEENNSEEIAGIEGSRQNVFGHLYQKTKNKNYLILAKRSATGALEIAKTNNLPAAMPYRDLAKAFEQMEDFENAVSCYQEAMTSEWPETHNRASVKADVKAHLAFAKYMNGDKTGLNLMNEAIAELEASDEQKYEKDVWLSGAHMRAAEMLREDNVELATEHLHKAKDIIDANDELKLRKEQWEELNKDFS